MERIFLGSSNISGYKSGEENRDLNYWFRNLFDFIREKETMNKKGATTTDLNNNNAVSEVSLNYKTQVGQFGCFSLIISLIVFNMSPH